MKEETANKILLELETGYDSISGKFSSTRAFMWRGLEFLKNYVKPSDKVLDFGCGNGRLAGFLENNFSEFMGVDVSQKLIDCAKQKYSNEKTKFIKIDPIFDKLPFDDNYFDMVFSIAAFHHFPGKEYRAKAAKELCRILKPGGRIVISTWNLWQKRFWKYHWQAIKNKIFGNSELDWGDLYIPFKAEDKVFQRYHHAFGKKELAELFESTGSKLIDCQTGKNLIYVGQKIVVDK